MNTEPATLQTSLSPTKLGALGHSLKAHLLTSILSTSQLHLFSTLYSVKSGLIQAILYLTSFIPYSLFNLFYTLNASAATLLSPPTLESWRTTYFLFYVKPPPYSNSFPFMNRLYLSLFTPSSSAIRDHFSAVLLF